MTYTTPFGTALRQYLGTLLWSELGDDGEPLDYTYDLEDIDHASVVASGRELLDFMRSNADDLADMDAGQVGHDFLLTRNRHGAGYWDRGLGERGERLTEMAQSHGETYAYVGDDGAVHTA
jgi:hypothetical protein